MTEKLTTESFVRQAQERYGDHFNYDSVVIKNSRTSVQVTCKQHGLFLANPHVFLTQGHKESKCPKCRAISRGSKSSIGTKRFISNANVQHGNKFDYSLVDYVNQYTKVRITCPEHGEFAQSPVAHLKGNGCPSCGRQLSLTTKYPDPLGYYISKAVEKYGEVYSYDRVLWKDKATAVEIECPAHGYFWQNMAYHTSKIGKGCPQCLAAVTKRHKEVEFKALAEGVHNGKYSYPDVKFSVKDSKVSITCPEHGPFRQAPNNHLQGQGCPQCGARKSILSRRKNLSSFIADAIDVHGDFYDYSRVAYVTAASKILIGCPKHGDFTQTASAHLYGANCYKCSKESMANTQAIPFYEFLKRARSAHGEAYDYSETSYKSMTDRVSVTCAIHGESLQFPNDHLKGSGCPMCGDQSGAALRASDTTEFTERATIIHDGKYSYKSVDYTTSKEKVTITCGVHGDFEQISAGHLSGHGCPSCGVVESKSELRLYQAVKALFPDAISRDRSGIAGRGLKMPLELDIYIPSANLAVEVHGLYWHSSAQQDRRGRDWVMNHQVNKMKACQSNNVQLLTVYEDEVDNKFDVVLNSIKAKAGIAQDSVFARKTKVQDVAWADAKAFLDTYHIQGACKPAKAKGLYDKSGVLTSLMIFDKARSTRHSRGEGVFEVIRYASASRVIGGCSKLLQAFLREVEGVKHVISYADKRFSNGKMYAATGFTLVKDAAPDYVYVYKNARKHKSNFTRARLDKLLPNFDGTLTEEQNCKDNKIFKLFNCGLQKWQLTL